MYAIIKTGGKQYKVVVGDVVDVELLGLDEGAAVEFTDVLFVYDGSKYNVGHPSVDGFIVQGEVLGESAGPKVISSKYKPRKRQKRTFGHKQHYSRVKIRKIAQA